MALQLTGSDASLLCVTDNFCRDGKINNHDGIVRIRL